MLALFSWRVRKDTNENNHCAWEELVSALTAPRTASNGRVPSAEVDAVLAEADAAGGKVTRAGAETFWGGYSGVFEDPDGHPWEVAHNPHWTLNDDGSVTLPG